MMDAEEIFKHVRIGHAVCMVEQGLALLAEHARDVNPDLAARIVDACAKYADARRALIDPLARPLPGSDARN